MNLPSPKRQHIHKGLRTLAGCVVLLVGIIAIPYPGPGWLIVFAGLAILARDYERARHLLDTLKARYEAWQAWITQQSVWVKCAAWLLTAAFVIATIYFLNGYGILNSLLNLGLDWLKSPLA